MTRFVHDQFAKQYLQELLSPSEKSNMELSPLYRQRLEDATQTGIQQGQRVTIEITIRTKFSEIDRDLAGIIEPLVQFPPQETIPLIMQSNRDQLLERFRNSTPDT